jgi:hypothetical protein
MVLSKPASLCPWTWTASAPGSTKYLLAFAACGRGESDDLHVLVQYYGVPLLLTITPTRSCSTRPAASTRPSFLRRRTDGSEIGRMRATYLITERPNGRRIAALAVHTPDDGARPSFG